MIFKSLGESKLRIEIRILDIYVSSDFIDLRSRESESRKQESKLETLEELMKANLETHCKNSELI